MRSYQLVHRYYIPQYLWLVQSKFGGERDTAGQVAAKLII